MSKVKTEISGTIATVTLNRPERRNALDLDLIRALVAAGEALAQRSDIRAVLLTGAGGTFSSGLDLAAMGKIAAFAAQEGGIMARSHGIANLFQRASTVWADLPMPVIAAIEGYAFGGGLQIALGADIRVAAPDAGFSIMEAKWGLVPDMGGMVALRRLVRADLLAQLALTARIFDGEQALKWGFVTELAGDPQARASALAGEIAERSPDAVRGIKALIRQAFAADDAALLLAESAAQEALIGGPNQMEAVLAGMENRRPRFSDPEPS